MLGSSGREKCGHDPVPLAKRWHSPYNPRMFAVPARFPARAWTLTPRGLLAAILFVALFAIAAQPSLDADLWWHLRTGQWIIENGAVPHADPFSSTRYGAPWVAHEWLADVGLYALYRAGGINALALATAAVVTLTFVVVYRMSETRPHLAVFTTFLAALASAVTWGPRPQMLTLLFAALTLFILERARLRGTRWLWLLLPLLLLWANVHSGFFLGLAIIGAHLAGAFAERLLLRLRVWRGPLQSLALRPVALALFGATLVSLLNPNGVQLLVYPFFTLFSHAMQTYIVEWHSPDFHDVRFMPFALLWLLLLASLALSARRPTLTEVLLTIGLGYESLVSIRNIPLFAIVAAPLITRQWACVLRPVTEPLLRPQRRVLSALNWTLLALTVFAVVVRVSAQWSAGEAQAMSQFPVSAADYVLAARPPGPLLNSYNFGGYLVWRLYPAYAVFIDGRADVYGDAFMDEYYARVWQGHGDWQEYLSRYNVRVVVMEKDGTLAGLLRVQPQWKLVHEDQLAAVFERSQ